MKTKASLGYMEPFTLLLMLPNKDKAETIKTLKECKQKFTYEKRTEALTEFKIEVNNIKNAYDIVNILP